MLNAAGTPRMHHPLCELEKRLPPPRQLAAHGPPRLLGPSSGVLVLERAAVQEVEALADGAPGCAFERPRAVGVLALGVALGGAPARGDELAADLVGHA